MSIRAGVIACALAGSAGLASGQLSHTLTLWGIDGADGQVFSIGDVSKPAGTFVDFGPLHIAEDGRLVPVGDGVQALTVVTEDRAFFALNRSVGETKGPVLLEVDLRNATPSTPLVGRVRGSLDTGSGGRVTGIAGDPLFGRLYALVTDTDPATPDTLVRSNMDAVGAMQAETVGPIVLGADMVSGGGDIAIGPGGMLLLTDSATGRVVKVDPGTGSMLGGLARGNGMASGGGMGAIAWDAVNNRAVLFREGSQELMVESLDADEAASAFDLAGMGITDAQGLSFVLSGEIPDEIDIRSVKPVASAAGPGAPPGIRSGGASPGGGGGGGGGQRSLFEPPPLDPFGPMVTEEPPIEDFPEGDPPFEEPPVGDPPLGDPPGPEDPRDPIVPAPGPVTLLGLVGAGVLGRRRRR